MDDVAAWLSRGKQLSVRQCLEKVLGALAEQDMHVVRNHVFCVRCPNRVEHRPLIVCQELDSSS